MWPRECTYPTARIPVPRIHPKTLAMHHETEGQTGDRVRLAIHCQSPEGVVSPQDGPWFDRVGDSCSSLITRDEGRAVAAHETEHARPGPQLERRHAKVQVKAHRRALGS